MKRWIKLTIAVIIGLVITSCGIVNRPPLAPSNPEPANGAIDQPLNLTISWNCEEPDGDYPLTYDVYFGTSKNNLNKISSKQSEESVVRNNLEYSTTYYWKVIPYDSKGKKRDLFDIKTWEFTTKENTEPNEPYNPQPNNYATNQPTNITLSWDCSDPDGDNLTYDIYFGTSSNPPLKKTGHTSESYSPGTLSYDTTYYWKIKAKDGEGGETTGPIWRFKTNNPPKPTISFVSIPESVCGGDKFEAIIEILNAENVDFALEREGETPIEPEVTRSGDLYTLIFETQEINVDKTYELVVEASNAGENMFAKKVIIIYKTDKIKPQISTMDFEIPECNATQTYIYFEFCDETSIDLDSLRWEVSHGAAIISANPVGDVSCYHGELWWLFGDVNGEYVEITLFISDRCGNEGSRTRSVYIDNME